MTRRTDLPRDTAPTNYILFKSEDEKDELEARNGLLQFDEVLRLVDEAIKPGASFKFRPSVIQNLHRFAIQDVYSCAGRLRDRIVTISNTTHLPPAPERVLEFTEQCCDYITDNWAHKSALHLASYLMWRINWIHPFMGGNGRTSRAVSYLVLCIKLGYKLPGTETIPEQVVANRQPYYSALDAADAADAAGIVDVTAMESLLGEMLAKQLAYVLTAAKTV